MQDKKNINRVLCAKPYGCPSGEPKLEPPEEPGWCPSARCIPPSLPRLQNNPFPVWKMVNVSHEIGKFLECFY